MPPHRKHKHIWEFLPYVSSFCHFSRSERYFSPFLPSFSPWQGRNTSLPGRKPALLDRRSTDGQQMDDIYMREEKRTIDEYLIIYIDLRVTYLEK
jgi:hypothetical protein